MQLREALNASNSKQPTGQSVASPRIRGFLLLYMIALVPFLLHAAVLTVGSMVIYAHPAAALHSHVLLGFLAYYVASNITLLVYGIVLFVLMIRRRRSAILNNVIFNILAVVFLLSWHLLGEKSAIGTVIDSVPNLVGAAYILMSTRARSTFIVR